MRVALLAIVLLLGTSVPTAAAGRMPPPTRRQLGELVDRFVKDVVLRRNLAEGWVLAGPDLRGGTTRAAWMSGKGVTAEAFPAVGNDFRHAWTGSLTSPTRAEFTVTLRSRGKNAQLIEAQTVALKRHGRWVVDIFYPAGIFRLGRGHHGSCGTADCAVSGANDYGPGSSSSADGPNPLPPQDAAHWLWIVLGSIGGLVAAAIVSLLLRVRLRDRRARQAYETSRFSSG